MKTFVLIRQLQQTAKFLAISLVLFACTVGPDYRKPDVADLTPTDWRWKVAEPKDAVPKGEWWEVFHDPVLDQLESDAAAGNEDLRAAVARVDEARAVARIGRSQFFPELSLDPLMKRERTSANQPLPIPISFPSMQLNTFSVPFDLSYEVDLWGRVRRSFESAQSQAGASVADYQNILLTLTADVAVNYFLLRTLDSDIDILRRTVELRIESVGMLNDRFEAGAIPEMDVDRAKTELAVGKAELADLTLQRTEILNALALLCGKPASAFEIAERSSVTSPPVVPVGLPSSVLERRPDIARAERLLAAKNSQIGVARAAYFPSIRLIGQAGLLSKDVDSLFSHDSGIWQIGSGVSMPLLSGGRIAAGIMQAEAAYQGALAEYRQIVLRAFKEVEDSLAQIELRKEQAVAQTDAVASAGRVAALAKSRYEAGAVSYLEVVEAQRDLLRYQRAQIDIEGQLLAASVRLIKALGGGWEEEGEGAKAVAAP